MSTPGHIILVTQFTPDPDGHGGNHRAYQIVQDLAGCFGKDKVSYISLDSPDPDMNRWRNTKPQPPPGPPGWLNLLFRERLPYLRAAHPIELLMGKWFLFKRYSSSEFSKHYREQVASLPRPLLCIMENAAFGPAILPVNKAQGIPTLACPQNIESWDRMSHASSTDPRRKYIACLDFADEWRVFEQCNATLFISKFEHSLFSGLGLKSRLYPYRPVGDVAAFWRGIRTARENTSPVPGSFLMLGSCSHKVTRTAFETVLHQLATSPRLPGFTLTLAGSLSDTLTVPEPLSRQVSLRGRISQPELSAELTRTSAMLVPHENGFGCLTRLSELSLGGVPVIASASAAHSMDPPPGIHWLDTAPSDAWSNALQAAMQTPPVAAMIHEVDAWSSRQANPLPDVAGQLLAGLS